MLHQDQQTSEINKNPSFSVVSDSQPTANQANLETAFKLAQPVSSTYGLLTGVNSEAASSGTSSDVSNQQQQLMWSFTQEYNRTQQPTFKNFKVSPLEFYTNLLKVHISVDSGLITIRDANRSL